MLIHQIMDNCALYRLPFKNPCDPRGMLSVIEGGTDIPFAIERVYYLTGTPGDVVRGSHAHRALKQYAMCVSGSCIFDINDGRKQDTIALSGPEIGLYMGPMLWREIRAFSPDCVLLVLASAHYDEADYIRNYSKFQELAR